jgi:transcriptional regulator with XRE-family HTH domain
MSISKLTGNFFRAGRDLVGLTRDELAKRAGLSRDVLRSWEVSSDSIVPAQYQMLCRALDVLEAEGVRFSDGGVHLQRSTVLPSDERAAKRPAILNDEGAAA